MDTEMVEIIGGPSKYKFLTSISLRMRNTEKVMFKVRHRTGNVEELHVDILAIMHMGDFDEEGEAHYWRFLTGTPSVIRNDHWMELDCVMLGLYSTGGKHGRSGSMRFLTSNQDRLLDAAFGHPKAWDDLKKKGFKLPDTKMYA